MVVVQFEFDVIPASIGASIYVLYWLVTDVFPRCRSSFWSNSYLAKTDVIKAFLADDFDDDDFVLGEPVPEPEVGSIENDDMIGRHALHRARTTGIASQTRRVFAIMVLILVFVIADLGLRGLLPLQFFGSAGELELGKTLSRMDPNIIASQNFANPLLVADEGIVVVVPITSLNDFAAPVDMLQYVAEGDPSIDRVLTVTLTRQLVETDDGEDFVRSAYYGTIMVGSPPEPFTVVFDTGSGHLVLPSAYCKSETCGLHRRYKRSASTSGRDINNNGKLVQPGQMRDQISVSFGTGQITGVFVEDIVCVDGLVDGSEAPRETSIGTVLPLDGQPLPPGCVTLRFIAATDLSHDPFKSFQFDGILGLGLGGLSQAPAFNFLEVAARSVHQRGSGLPQTFAVFLAENEQEDSEIALGGWAQKHLVEDLSWSPVKDPEIGHWILPIRGIRVDGERLDFCDHGCKAAVDTGTSHFSVPTAAFPELYELLKHPAPLAGHCQGYGPLLHIELDHFTVTLGPRDYARLEPASHLQYDGLYEGNEAVLVGGKPTRQDLRCLPMLMTLDLPEPLGPKLFILGEPVLRKYYTVFDGPKKQVGFARAKHRQVLGRGDLLIMAADIGSRTNAASGAASTPKRSRLPTMFDVFRWRRELS